MSNQRFDYTGFTGLRIERALSVDVLRADSYSLTIGDDFCRVVVEKAGDTLIVSRRGMDMFALFHQRPHVVITMPELKEITMTGACQGKVLGFQSYHIFIVRLTGACQLDIGQMKAAGFKVNIHGASNLTGDITIEREAWFNVSGASRVELSGSGDSAKIELAGASQLRLGNMTMQTASVNISGASSAQIKVEKDLDLILAGASRLEYSGAAALNKVQISGASTLKKR
jgi:hypothetical protein